MSTESTRTMQDALDEIRDDLDEALDEDTNFWTDSFLLRRMNRGLREVWQTARECHENWFVRALTSQDPILMIFGRPFDPTEMRLTGGMNEMRLPPDLFDLRFLEPLPAQDANDAGLVFRYADMSAEKFRVLSRNTGPTVAGGYTYDIVFRDEGPKLRIAPQIGLTEPLDVRIEYVRAVKHFIAEDTFEGSGFNDIMVDAAIAYTILEARRKEGDQSNISMALESWNDKMGMVRRSSGPRQTQEREYVDGFLEDEID